MGDDFFEEEQEPKPTPKQTKKSAPKTKKETPNVAKKIVAKKSESQSPITLPQSVDLTWAVALVVVAFVVGFLVRGLFIPATSVTANTGLTGTGVQAPELTPEQIQGGLPAGHPAIPSGSPTTTLKSGTSPSTTAPSGQANTGGNK